MGFLLKEKDLKGTEVPGVVTLSPSLDILKARVPLVPRNAHFLLGVLGEE